MSDNRQRLWSVIHSILVSGFLFAFLGLGFQALKALQLHRMIMDEPGGLREALASEASTDGYIRELLKQDVSPAPTLSQPAAAIRAALTELPADGAVLFVAPRKLPRYEVMFLTVKTLTLPRSIYLVWCDDPKQIENAQNAAKERLAGVMYYLVPPSAGSARTIIPQLAIAPVSEPAPWTSYCSQ